MIFYHQKDRLPPCADPISFYICSFSIIAQFLLCAIHKRQNSYYIHIFNLFRLDFASTYVNICIQYSFHACRTIICERSFLMKFAGNHITPRIRIQKIELNNFKCVSHGEIEIKRSRKSNSQGVSSDILGIYGQNGSGKSAVIEALTILKRAMSGDPVSPRYSECIASGAEYATLAFTFDLHYSSPIDFSRTVVYSFKIGAVPNETKDDSDGHKTISSRYPTKVIIFEETISASGIFNSKDLKMQDILTTTGNHYPIGPVRKITEYVGDQKESAVIDLEVNKRTASRNSSSFIFMSETIDLFTQRSKYYPMQ